MPLFGPRKLANKHEVEQCFTYPPSWPYLVTLAPDTPRINYGSGLTDAGRRLKIVFKKPDGPHLRAYEPNRIEEQIYNKNASPT